jgi:hypothetical protein
MDYIIVDSKEESSYVAELLEYLRKDLHGKFTQIKHISDYKRDSF